MTRRLAAIMFTDIAGYTALSQRDEPAALRLLQDQERLVRGLLEVHRGRLVKSIGDGLLIEFANALDAVECAVDLQRHIQERNAREAPPELRVRIGIHLGDVEGVGPDILGDAVNVASRIEPLADPGGVCVTEPVFGLVHRKVSFHLEGLGPKTLKGVQEPLEVYRIIVPERADSVAPPAKVPGPPRLAVLPFANISPDPKDEYFADGLTEELITVLSQLRGLRVIARTSVTPYKSTSKGVSQIGAELGVNAVLEGSVRKAGDELRITVQLIDVGTQEHTWANTYDRKLEKVFAIQAEIAKQVAEALKVGLRAAEEARLESRPPVRPDSYLAYLKGRSFFHGVGRTSYEAAREQFELAISLDSKNAAAHSGLSDVTRYLGTFYGNAPRAEWDQTGRRLAARAIDLDPMLAEGHTSLGMILWDDFDYVAAEREFTLALSLNPSYSLAHEGYAALLEDEARAEEALLHFALAEAADPLGTHNLILMATLLLWLGRYDEALVKIRRIGELEPSPWANPMLLINYYFYKSDFAACLRELSRYEALVQDPRRKAGARAWTYALSGEKEQARALLREEERLRELPVAVGEVAQLYAQLGDLDDCFRLVEKLVDDRLIYFQPWRLDPALEHVRGDPRFQVLLKRMNLA